MKVNSYSSMGFRLHRYRWQMSFFVAQLLAMLWVNANLWLTLGTPHSLVTSSIGLFYFPFAFTHFMFHFSYCNLLAYRTLLHSFGLVMSADIQFFITIGVDSSLLLAQPYFNHFLKKSLKCLCVGRVVRQNTIFSV